jgi:hypothetical protein
MWFFSNKEKRIKKAALECTRALMVEYDEKIKQSVENIKKSDNEIDNIRNNFKTLNIYLEAIVLICQKNIESKEVNDKVSQLFEESKKYKFE